MPDGRGQAPMKARQPLGPAFLAAALRRLPAHGAAFFAAWPLLSLALAWRHPAGWPDVLRQLPALVRLEALAAAWVLLLPQLLAVAAAELVFSVLLFAAIEVAAARRRAPPAGSGSLCLEPALLLYAQTLGVALEFPAVLGHPLLGSIAALPYAGALATLAGFAACVAAVVALPWGVGATAGMLAAVSIGALSSWLLAGAPAAPSGGATSGSIALVDLSGLTPDRDPSLLRTSLARHGVAWYERPVPPALTPGDVWASILGQRPPSADGLRRLPDAGPASEVRLSLLVDARKAGYRAVARLGDRSAAFLGAAPDFRLDRSGPAGWLQPATAAIKDSGVLLSIFLPRLPDVPGAGTPANQAGTWGFDLPRELDGALAAPPGSIVAFQCDFLRQPYYPSFGRLSGPERDAVRRALVHSLRDHGPDPEHRLIPGEPLSIAGWKARYLQQAFAEALERAAFLAPASGNRLVVFSEPGAWDTGLDDAVDGERRAAGAAILATFGLPVRDLEAPASLLEIGGLLGFGPPPERGSLRPVIAAAWPSLETRGRLALTASLGRDGRLALDAAALEASQWTLRTLEPFRGRRARPGGRP
ncbi:MAG: hypothetical protein HY554_12535 [Elusimicrobia bacterium]|nr:hypothetical protein [Elusimicrobiota bacterium]